MKDGVSLENDEFNFLTHEKWMQVSSLLLKLLLQREQTDNNSLSNIINLVITTGDKVQLMRRQHKTKNFCGHANLSRCVERIS